jgi:hypothetical protein
MYNESCTRQRHSRTVYCQLDSNRRIYMVQDSHRKIKTEQSQTLRCCPSGTSFSGHLMQLPLFVQTWLIALAKMKILALPTFLCRRGSRSRMPRYELVTEVKENQDIANLHPYPQ